MLCEELELEWVGRWKRQDSRNDLPPPRKRARKKRIWNLASILRVVKLKQL